MDYVETYLSKEGFDFPRLLNDDFFQPIRLLYNRQHCRRRRLRVPLSPGSPVPRDPPGDFGAVLRPGHGAA
jgi:hypothetical protein